MREGVRNVTESGSHGIHKNQEVSTGEVVLYSLVINTSENTYYVIMIHFARIYWFATRITAGAISLIPSSKQF
jgi:hypothetical protein